MSGNDDKWWRGTPGFYDRDPSSPDLFDLPEAGLGARYPSYQPSKRCYTSHPPLRLGSTGLVIHGGSCISPVVTDADVYIGFDSSMRFTSRQWPWTPGHELLLQIADMHAPSKPRHFAKLVDWTIDRLTDRLKVHCGCIGGHGRTGTFLAALVRVMCDEPDAIAYVRQHYCKKAVESQAQVAFLEQYFGVEPVPPTKGHGSAKSYGGSAGRAPRHPDRHIDKVAEGLNLRAGPRGGKQAGKTQLVTPVRGVTSIWARGK